MRAGPVGIVRSVQHRPLLSQTFDRSEQLNPEPGSAYVYGEGLEERTSWVENFRSTVSGVTFAKVTEQSSTSSFKVELKGATHTVSLRSSGALQNLLDLIGGTELYLDLTGLAHHVWAPMLKAGFARGRRIRAVYVEPRDYRFSATPTEGQIFDLSERIRGVSPIPGFASLGGKADEDICFVPLLGFEGTRLRYVLEQVEPPGGKIFPVIGVPGFRPEYPFHTYLGNKAPLEETRAWRNVRLAAANCPFSLFYALEDISEEHPGDRLVVAPIGTRPHALGAVLYSLARPGQVELVYDHPIPSARRTVGAGRLLVYDVSAFASL